MRYSTFSISKEITQSIGIEEIKIERLSNVIAFIGKNGSGKTRILDLIEKYPFNSSTNIDKIPNDLQESIKLFELIIEYEDLINHPKTDANWNNQLNGINLQLRHYSGNKNKNYIEKVIFETIKQKYLCRIKQEEITILENFLNENNEQDIFENLIEKNKKNNNSLTTNIGLSSIKKGALKYLTNLPHKLASDNIDCKVNDVDLNTKDSYNRFSSLKKYVSIFLNKNLDWKSKESAGSFLNLSQDGGGYNKTYKGYFTLNGREFKHEELSPGEKILFTYAVLFFLLEQNSQINISESIILIDEPELHLHADSEIDLITKLREIISEKGQLIIATHSINILSTLNYEEIFVVKDGIIKNPGRDSLTSSLIELIGIKEKINRLSDLLNSIENYSYINFINQCFSEQDAIKTLKENDPQLKDIKNIIRTKLNNPNTNFLDFGAGKGRILNGLLKDNNIFSKIKYHALEPKTDYHTELKKTGISNIYSDYQELPDNYFDFILLANVLHEIPVTSWELTLNKIIDSLSGNGVLMIMEQKTLAKGEMIDDVGFLVLDEEGIKTLFNLSNEIKSFHTEGYRDKTTSVIIQKNELKKINKKSIIDTLVVVQKNSLNNIGTLRKKECDNTNEYDRGRKTAFHTVQYVNAELGLDLFNK